MRRILPRHRGEAAGRVLVGPPEDDDVMATQTRLPDLDARRSPHLDRRSREAGRKGLAKARAALAETIARTHAERTDDGHAHAA
jgi:hypothetical protein